MPADALGVAYPGDSNPSRVDYEDGLMKLSGGDISARIPHEITSARPYQTTSRLLVLPGKSEEQAEEAAEGQAEEQADTAKSESKKIVAPRVQNRLDADVKWAVIRTEDGYFVVDDLQLGQTVEATPADLVGGSQVARAITYELSPRSVGSGPSRRYNSAYGNQFDVSLFGQDVRVVNQLRSGNLKQLLDRPNTYVAIMEEFPMAAQQLEPVQYKMQLHVVRGQW